MAGTLTGRPRTEPRLVMVDDHTVEVPPAPHMVVVRNDDRAGMIGVVGTILGEAGVSISSMAVGPSPAPTTAMMVISTVGSSPEPSWISYAVTRGSSTSTGSVSDDQSGGLARHRGPRVEAADDGLAPVEGALRHRSSSTARTTARAAATRAARTSVEKRRRIRPR